MAISNIKKFLSEKQTSIKQILGSHTPKKYDFLEELEFVFFRIAWVPKSKNNKIGFHICHAKQIIGTEIEQKILRRNISIKYSHDAYPTHVYALLDGRDLLTYCPMMDRLRVRGERAGFICQDPEHLIWSVHG